VSATSHHQAGRLIIICGLPGSGKTTLAKQLERDRGAVRFCPDEWMASIGADLFDEQVRDRIEQIQWRVAQRLLQLRQVVLVEWGTWAHAERAALREGARALGAAVELRFLDAPIEVLWERVRGREMERNLGRRPLTRLDIEDYARKFERPDLEELSLFDSP
jgi:predicted kinase